MRCLLEAGHDVIPGDRKRFRRPVDAFVNVEHSALVRIVDGLEEKSLELVVDPVDVGDGRSQDGRLHEEEAEAGDGVRQENASLVLRGDDETDYSVDGRDDAKCQHCHLAIKTRIISIVIKTRFISRVTYHRLFRLLEVAALLAVTSVPWMPSLPLSRLTD